MKCMAKKMKLMPLFQELQGRARILNRRPTATGTGVFLMQLRANSGTVALPSRRVVISVKQSANASLPHPVKINHATPEAPSLSPGSRPVRGEAALVPQVQPNVA